LPTLEQDVEVVVEQRCFGQPYLPEADAIREAAFAAFDRVMRGAALREADWEEDFDAAPGAEIGATLPRDVEPPNCGAGSPSALTEAQRHVLEHARQMLVQYRRQHDARLRANHAEETWAAARYSSTATPEEVKAANRTRLAAQKDHDRAWIDYLATAEHLCRTVERLVELEAPTD
jgi:hypothetical protein